MCGILASFSKKSISQNEIKEALFKIRHRGPDDYGIWHSDDFHTWIAHVRLSTTGISNGKQPLIDQNNKIVAVVNGEFYNYKNIKKILTTKGYAFKTDTDSEILIALYLEYGTDCVHYLRGEFAFVLYDIDKKCIFSARDRFGIKPLYYYYKKSELYIASEAKSLLSLGVEAKWNTDNVCKSEHLFLINQQDTCFQNIYQLKPGNILILKNDNLTTQQYWDFNFPSITHVFSNDLNETVEILRKKLVDSVKMRLEADVEVACYLSGGLDSSCIASIAAKELKHKLKTFTIKFKNSQYDESVYAEKVAKFINSDHYTYFVSDDMLADNFEKSVWHSETITPNTHGAAKYLLSHFVNKNNIKVVLTGEGADELFGGYLFFVNDAVATSNISNQEKLDLFNKLHEKNKINGSLFNNIENDKMKNLYKQLGYVPSFLHFARQYGENMGNFHTQKFSDLLKEKDIFSAFINNIPFNESNKNIHDLNKSLYLWSKSHFPAYILTVVGDRMEMANSIEGRTPFLDHEFVELVTKIPVEYKINGIDEKFILKKIASAFLPDEIINRQKHSFVAPPIDLSPKTKFGQLMGDHFHSNVLNELFFYDSDKVIKFYNDIVYQNVDQRKDTEKYLLHILSMCILKNRYKICY